MELYEQEGVERNAWSMPYKQIEEAEKFAEGISTITAGKVTYEEKQAIRQGQAKA
jgi:hypothetical protein